MGFLLMCVGDSIVLAARWWLPLWQAHGGCRPLWHGEITWSSSKTRIHDCIERGAAFACLY